MADSANSVTDLIDQFLDEEDREALTEACKLAASTPTLDMSELLSHVQDARTDRLLKAEALRRLRAALNLPPMPGAVCRPQPFD